MKITNNRNLPDIILRAVQNDPYSRGKSDISVTQLINPPQQVALQHLHKEELIEDVADRIYALLGSSVHHMIERAAGPDDRVEERIFAKVHGWTVSGQFDLLEPDGTLSDVKVTSVWSIKDAIKHGKSDWESQLNLLAELLDMEGECPSRLQIIAIARDWSKTGRMRDKDYPGQVELIPIELWEKEKRRAYLEERVDLHQRARKGDYDRCTMEETWAKPDKYAVMKEGRKSALRLLDSLSAAGKWCVDNNHGSFLSRFGDEVRFIPDKGISIERRQGEATRCEYYCNVRDYCSQYSV